MAPVKNQTKEQILNAAEKVFSLKGYHGTSMRAIAREAQVTQALIHYHWNTKAQLFDSIICRGATITNTCREKLLAQCFREASQGIPTLEQVLETFIRPAIEQGRSRQGCYFSQIIAMFVNSNDPQSRELIRKYYDPIAHKYIHALEQVLPHFSRSEIYWGYLLATSVVVSAMARTDRIRQLSKGAFEEDDTQMIIHRLIHFIASGIYGLARMSGPVPSSTLNLFEGERL